MAGVAGASERGRVRNIAVVVVPCALTAIAFGIASHFNLVGDLPFWVLLVFLGLGGVLGEITGTWITPEARPRALHGALAAQALSVTTIIYAIGWGPTLTVGYVFTISRALDNGG